MQQPRPIDEPEPIEPRYPYRLAWRTLIIGIILLGSALFSKADPQIRWTSWFEHWPLGIVEVCFMVGYLVAGVMLLIAFISGVASIVNRSRSRYPGRTAAIAALGLFLSLLVVYFLIDALVFHHPWYW